MQVGLSSDFLSFLTTLGTYTPLLGRLVWATAGLRAM